MKRGECICWCQISCSDIEFGKAWVHGCQASLVESLSEAPTSSTSPANPTQPSARKLGQHNSLHFPPQPINSSTAQFPPLYINFQLIVSDEEYDIGDLVGDCDDCTDGRTSAVINYTQSRYR